MLFGNDEGEFIRAETFVAEVGRMPGEEPEADIHAAFFDGGLDLRRRDFLHCQADPGMTRREETEQRRHEGDVENRDHAYMQRAAQLSGLARQFLEEIFQV